jgi:hypothetical protein
MRPKRIAPQVFRLRLLKHRQQTCSPRLAPSVRNCEVSTVLPNPQGPASRKADPAGIPPPIM